MDIDFNTKNALHNGWQVIFQKDPDADNNFWCNKSFNRLRQAIYKKFESYSEEEWEVYKNLNDITEGIPQKMTLTWENVFSQDKEVANLKGSTELELEFHDKENKRIIIKDPLVGISWDYDEPKEGSWISIPEKLSEKLIMMDSFKN